jgi:Transcriptional regulators containing a DNA-binding HTH domain and an aminotransferase domain (MocR family) and their eukaryotic orthologs
MEYASLSREDAQELLEKEQKKYKKFQSMKLSLDMSRGKPCKEQLDMVSGIFDMIDSKTDFKLKNGMDARNYGCLDGITELRELFAELFRVTPEEVYVGDGSSLSLMYAMVQHAFQFGFLGNVPWNKLKKVKFICLTPGYDRHFGICENFGIEMINVPLNESGVNYKTVEALVATDPSIKGIWCVPKYSNPTGLTYSDEVVDHFANMKAAPDFRIFWDNAYCVHTLYNDEPLKDIVAAAKEAGNHDRVLEFSSTSKITLAGAGVSVLVSSPANLKDFLAREKYRTIGPNKVSQLMHFKYLKSVDNITAIMKNHADILRPKFDVVLSALEDEFSKSDVIGWTKPNGGYFISVDLKKCSAKRVVQLAAEAGVKFTSAGATYPLGYDDRDSNLRIAPSYPPIEELKTAMEVFCCAVKIAALERLI